MTLAITEAQAQQAEDAFIAGGAPALWEYLDSQGDNYADDARDILGRPASFMGQIVTQSWISAGADLAKFPAVAEDFARNYLQLIWDNKGTLPHGGQITGAYRGALYINDVPVAAAIDSTMAVRIWTRYLGMEPSRQQGLSAFPDRSTADKVTQWMRAAIAALSSEHQYIYNKTTGHWFNVQRDPQGNIIATEDASPAMESRLNALQRAQRQLVCTPEDTDGNGIPDNIENLKKKFSDAQKIVSPVVLDLNGDGTTTTGMTNGAYFDHDANGFAEQTGWVNSQDGILVLDKNSNGAIDSGRELFGSETLLVNGQQAANGYAALAELDTNLDGQIDSQDAAYTTLKIWKDTNGDGRSSTGELFTLADAGVQSIATGYTAVNQTDANGNITQQTGTFTKTDGSTGNSADIWFKVDKTNTLVIDQLPETAAVAALPDLQGFGNVRDLHQAMLRDTTGYLQDFCGVANDVMFEMRKVG